MQSDEARNEPRETTMPGDFARDPLELAESLAKEYARLSDAYEAPGGTRDQLNVHLEWSYRLGFFYYQNLDKYRVFQAHEYFHDLRQKPNEHNIMRSVLKFTMQAKRNKQRLYRLYKRAPVFEYLYGKGVIPDDVAALLKEHGGIDFIYDQLCAEKKLRREKLPIEDENNDSDRVEAGDVALEVQDIADADAVADEEDEDEDDEEADHTTSAESTDSSGDPHAVDQGECEATAMPKATNDASNVLHGNGEPDDPPKQGRLDVIDLETTVAIEMEQPHQIDMVLRSSGGLIRFKVWPRDKRGWRRVTGHIVSLDAQGDHQSPDAPNGDVV